MQLENTLVEGFRNRGAATGCTRTDTAAPAGAMLDACGRI